MKSNNNHFAAPQFYAQIQNERREDLCDEFPVYSSDAHAKSDILDMDRIQGQLMLDNGHITYKNNS